jgi:hypothetical protein
LGIVFGKILFWNNETHLIRIFSLTFTFQKDVFVYTTKAYLVAFAVWK